ncbi:MAG: hypothetical protein KatS3mg095_0222 [Candidatus Parcubacteria bacterium]|nr:MAG: hypothetical protein KatS3mg095_0222 [Candidatus Parcubacteria bacterium]
MRLLVNLIFIILFFVLVNSVFTSLIPAYRNFLNSSEEKNKFENELLEVKALKDQFKILESEQIGSIVKIKKSGYLDYFLPSKYIDYELTMFINQLFYIAGFTQPNVYSFNKEEIIHPQFNKNKATKFSFTITEQTNLDNLLKLISTLENSSRIFEIESLTLQRNNENNNLDVNMKISTYYFTSN